LIIHRLLNFCYFLEASLPWLRFKAEFHIKVPKNPIVHIRLTPVWTYDMKVCKRRLHMLLVYNTCWYCFRSVNSVVYRITNKLSSFLIFVYYKWKWNAWCYENVSEFIHFRATFECISFGTTNFFISVVCTGASVNLKEGLRRMIIHAVFLEKIIVRRKRWQVKFNTEMLNAEFKHGNIYILLWWHKNMRF